MTDRPSPTITVGHSGRNADHYRIEEWADCSLDETSIGREWDKLKPGEQSDKYPSLIRPAHEGQPLTTITAQLGHSSTAVTDRYLAKIAPADLIAQVRDRGRLPTS